MAFAARILLGGTDYELRKSSEVVVFEIGGEFGKAKGLGISRRHVSERREAASPIWDCLFSGGLS
jgi:hypothetical protein